MNFTHLFMVSLVPFSTAWVADTRLAAVPVSVYAAVFVLVNLAYCAFVWEALAQAEVKEISASISQELSPLDTRSGARLRLAGIWNCFSQGRKNDSWTIL